MTAADAAGQLPEPLTLDQLEGISSTRCRDQIQTGTESGREWGKKPGRM